MKLTKHDYNLLFTALENYRVERDQVSELKRLEEKLKTMYVNDSKGWLPSKRFCIACRKVSEMIVW